MPFIQYQWITNKKPLPAVYSNLINTNIRPYLASDINLKNVSCLHILKLYYIEASNSIMTIDKKIFNALLKKFASGQCQNNKTDPWLWKFLPSMYKNELQTVFTPILIDNSLTWKEDIIWGIELLFSFGLEEDKNTRPSNLYKAYQIGINPYRFDRMGFDDKTFNLSHLHQCILYLFIGLIISWIVFCCEEYCFIISPNLIPFKSKIKQKM